MVYRRHTNFSIESITQNFSKAANFGETVSCIISRAGDLIGRIFLYVEIPALPKFINQTTGKEDFIKKMAWVNNLGYALIQEISIDIAGKQIDKQYGEWMYIWSQLTNRQDTGLNKMIGNVPSVYEFSNGKPGYKLYIPLEFWFCRNIGLSLPLVALASSEIKLIVTFRKLEECYRFGPTNSIEILEDIVPFKPGDYIEQTINNQTIFGYVINYDYLKKRLYYIKIQNPTAHKKTFEALPDLNISKREIYDQINSPSNIIYRIYNSISNVYCTPKPNVKENIEQITLPYKPQFVNCFLYVNYIYLDNDERDKFLNSNHEYLIEQIQYNQEINIKSPNVKQNLTLNHPCKSHYWIAQLDRMIGPGTINDIFNYTTSHIHYQNNDKSYKQEQFYGKDIVHHSKLLLNGRNRFSGRDPEYFNLLEPYNHHYRGPSPGINMYSFSIYPENHQPSSTINMSKIDQINMIMKLDNKINSENTCKIRSYTINYNILRIFSSLGGIAFE